MLIICQSNLLTVQNFPLTSPPPPPPTFTRKIPHSPLDIIHRAVFFFWRWVKRSLYFVSCKVERVTACTLEMWRHTDRLYYLKSVRKKEKRSYIAIGRSSYILARYVSRSCHTSTLRSVHINWKLCLITAGIARHFHFVKLVVNQVFIKDHVHTKTRPVNPVGQAAGYNEQYTIAKYINNNNSSYSVIIYVTSWTRGNPRDSRGGRGV